MADTLLERIKQALARSLSEKEFETQAVELLSQLYPNLVPVEGGNDAGMDGVGSVDGRPFLLVATTGKDVLCNLAPEPHFSSRCWRTDTHRGRRHVPVAIGNATYQPREEGRGTWVRARREPDGIRVARAAALGFGLRPRVAHLAEAVVAVAVGVRVEVLLVVRLGVVERACGRDLRDDLAVAGLIE